MALRLLAATAAGAVLGVPASARKRAGYILGVTTAASIPVPDQACHRALLSTANAWRPQGGKSR